MRCRRCKAPAVMEVRRHNAGFCATCFMHHCAEQVRRAIEEHKMIAPGERVLVAVSGGKDSLALWDLLLDLGYEVDGLYLGLGIGAYSEESGSYVRAFAEARGAGLIEIDLPSRYGFGVPGGAAAAKRVPCSACGLSKRHLFNRAALEGGYDVVATGHNLDDEAAVLLGNVLRWSTDYLGRQEPVLPEADGFARKVKPLI
ncbi:MAG: adenine nucleotide alpha hydrolase family protein, partial [Acidimicrobiales bacterium]